MSYLTTLAAHALIMEREQDAYEAMLADLDANVPDWETREQEGEEGGRFVSEADFPVWDDSADEALVSDADWQEFLAESYSDPAEWEDR